MTPPPAHTPAPLSAGVGHYENFPVASLLCPPTLRSPVMAIYHFARTADDIADEGDLDSAARLQLLARYRRALERTLAGEDIGSDWPQVFGPLGVAVRTHALPGPLLHDLLSAFEQDVRHTAAGHHYAAPAELLTYCRLSANPVGRLLLHLYGVSDATALKQSDQICSALQLINFWQDIRVDHARARHYLPTDALARHGVQLADFAADAQPEPATQVRMARAVAALCLQAHGLMLEGAPLARRVPGRAGWELRLVVQGGLRTLEKLANCGHQSWKVRPRLRVWDVPVLLWRALWMP
jgi:squalene synthase HpnC